jgi:hypothetical protein
VTKYLREQPKKGKIYYGLWFQKFQSIVLGSVDSGSMVRQNIMAVGACGGGSCHYMADKKQIEEGNGDQV